MHDVEELAAIAVDRSLYLHRRVGPGMLESAYETILSELLQRAGLRVERQVPIRISCDDIVVAEGFRADLVVESMLLIELKSIERLNSVHGKQVLTYLRFMNLSLGLLINFGAPTLRVGLRRIVNNHHDTAKSPLAVNRPLAKD